MLQRLIIQNFTLIDHLDIEFHAGFSVITGETGAGKSIILGAIGLLLGNRADAKLIRSGAKKCVIEAHFSYQRQDFFVDNDIDFDPDDCILRREISATGKSRAFINDTPVSLALMRELGEHLIDIHSQHQNLLLQKEDFQLNVIDIIAHDNELQAQYRNSFDAYNRQLHKIESLKTEIENNRRNEDFMQFQFKELDDMHLQADEQEQLEQEQEMLSHAEDIKGSLYFTDNALSGDDNSILQQLKDIDSQLDGIRDYMPDIDELTTRINSCYVELKDISGDIAQHLNRVDFDPQRLQVITERLDGIYTLQRKFQVETVADLMALHDQLEEQLRHLSNSDETLAEEEALLQQLEAQCRKHAEALTVCRTAAAHEVESAMKKYLVPLGIPNVQFDITFQVKPLAADGQDKVAFLFSANKNMPLQPISQVASGGEIARVMLSLKALISGAVCYPTIIFDEIDTGVSGRVAEMMADIMAQMGETNEQGPRQVFSITHLPQIAARGNNHYKVTKEDQPDGTISHMALLNNEQRVAEIAQMLSGSSISEAAINNARELLKQD